VMLPGSTDLTIHVFDFAYSSRISILFTLLRPPSWCLSQCFKICSLI
jgi:hypothetical protein